MSSKEAASLAASGVALFTIISAELVATTPDSHQARLSRERDSPVLLSQFCAGAVRMELLLF